MLKFRDMDLDFDIFDADQAELYEDAVSRFQQECKALPEDGTLSTKIRRQCALVFDFFDDLFGDGFHKDIFGDKTNLDACLGAFKEFTSLVNAQKNVLLDKYAANNAPNRATRRAAARRP